MFDELISHFVLTRRSWQVREKVHSLCHTQTKTYSKYLRSELRSLSKVFCSISEFISRVVIIVDTLMSMILIGDLVLHFDKIELVLEALSTKFDLIIDVVNTKSEFVSLDGLESLLITQETCVDKFKKEVIGYVFVNLTQSSSQINKFLNLVKLLTSDTNFLVEVVIFMVDGSKAVLVIMTIEVTSSVKFPINVDTMQAIVTIIIPQMLMVVMVPFNPIYGHNLAI